MEWRSRYQTELADMLARLFYGEPATPAPLSADPAVAELLPGDPDAVAPRQETWL